MRPETPQTILSKERLELEAKKRTPVFQRNQVYADGVNLSARSRSKLYEPVTFLEFGSSQSELIVICGHEV
jgi:hypothetical protein